MRDGCATGVLNLMQAGRFISLYDKNAIEAAVQIKGRHRGNVIALSVGTEKVKDSRRDALSRGPDEACFVTGPSLAGADSFVTARVLVAAIKKLGEVDVILCGEGSGDDYAQRAGPRIAQLLGIPALTYVSKVEWEDGKVRVERTLEDGIEVVESPLPVVITPESVKTSNVSKVSTTRG